MQLAPPGPPPLRGRKAGGGRGTAAAALRPGACKEGQRGPGVPEKWSKTNWQGRSSTNQLATPPHLVLRRVAAGQQVALAQGTAKFIQVAYKASKNGDEGKAVQTRGE